MQNMAPCTSLCTVYFLGHIFKKQNNNVRGWHQNKKRGQCPRFWGGRGGGSEIPENADILGVFFPRKFFSSLGLYTILTKIYKNSSISAN